MAQWLGVRLPMQGRGFVPRSGKIPHAAERLGPWAVAAGPARPEPVLHGGRGHSSEGPAYRKKKKKKKEPDCLKIPVWSKERVG